MSDTAPVKKQSVADEAALLPPVDVIEDASGITLYADLPGVTKDKLHLQIEADTLTIEGEIDLEMPGGMEASHAEVSLPRYRRVFTLSKELDAGKVAAEFNQGVLKLSIPKAEHAQPRKVEIRIASADRRDRGTGDAGPMRRILTQTGSVDQRPPSHSGPSHGERGSGSPACPPLPATLTTPASSSGTGAFARVQMTTTGDTRWQAASENKRDFPRYKHCTA